jgi:magnesium-transporting ATPase (P-type)
MDAGFLPAIHPLHKIKATASCSHAGEGLVAHQKSIPFSEKTVEPLGPVATEVGRRPIDVTGVDPSVTFFFAFIFFLQILFVFLCRPHPQIHAPVSQRWLFLSILVLGALCFFPQFFKWNELLCEIEFYCEQWS